MFGLLNLQKPSGPTSRDVVNRVERLVRPAKAGHAGTLDPLASGVLVVCLGRATRLIGRVQAMPKTYTATFAFGRRSPSDDVESEVEEVAGALLPTAAEIRRQLPRFTGTIQQRPPAFSAVKVAGQRAYKLARRGAEVELAPRPVEVYRLELLSVTESRVELEIVCGSGTYIRALGRDLAESLGTCAVMTELTRTAVGPFRQDEAIPYKSLTAETLPTRLISPAVAVPDLPRWVVSAAEVVKIANGVLLRRPESLAVAAEYGAVDAAGNLVALLVPFAGDLYKPAPNFSQP